MLGHEDLSVYQKGTMPEAMVYRAAFVHTRGDKGCQKVSLEIDRFLRNVQVKKSLFRYYTSDCRENVLAQGEE